MRILHCFADHGVESECLADYGNVVRIGLNAVDTNQSQPVKADARDLPFKESAEFDLGLFHPPCTKWSEMPSADTENAPNLIPLAREIAQQHCTDYIIENKPRAPLNNQVNLSGDMFGLPVDYKRAFETSFPLEQPPQQQRFSDSPGQPFFYTEYSKEWWASVKGYSPNYSAIHLSRNAVPRIYLEYILRHWIEATDTEDRPDYSEYGKEMDAKRAKEANTQLTQY